MSSEAEFEVALLLAPNSGLDLKKKGGREHLKFDIESIKYRVTSDRGTILLFT